MIPVPRSTLAGSAHQLQDVIEDPVVEIVDVVVGRDLRARAWSMSIEGSDDAVHLLGHLVAEHGQVHVLLERRVRCQLA